MTYLKKLGAAAIAVCLLVLLTLPDGGRHLIRDGAQELTVVDAIGEIPGEDEGKQRPNDWFFLQRAYPGFEIPDGKAKAAIDYARAAKESKRAPADISWSAAGPYNIPGRVADLAVHPTNRNIIYAGSASGGVFKTTNHGASWAAIFDDYGTPSIGALAIDPSNPDVLYVGTGEPNASGDSQEGTGVYKTTNGGVTWEFKGLGNSYHIGRIKLHPFLPQTVYVAACGKLFGTNPDRGLYRSTDGGDSWDHILYIDDSTGCVDVALCEFGDVVFAAAWERIRDPGRRKVGGQGSGIYFSDDAAETWRKLGPSDGLPADADTIGRIGLTTDWFGDHAAAVYANHPGYLMGVYRCDLPFFGIWSEISEYSTWGGDQLHDVLYGSSSSYHFGWYFGQIRMAPGDPQVLYLLGVRSYRNDFGGSDFWQQVFDDPWVDHHALWVSEQTPDSIVGGCDGGVYYSTDGGQSSPSFLDMPNCQFYAITIDYLNPHRLYGGTQDRGSLRTLGGGLDDWERFWYGDGFYCLVDYTDSDIIYAESQNGYLVRSTNGGDGWDYIYGNIPNFESDRHNWNTPIAMDPNDPSILYYGSNHLYRTTDRGDTWTQISGDLTNGPHPWSDSYGSLTTIGVTPSNNQVVYVGTDDANVWVTTNGGGNWTQIDAALPDRWITRVTVDHDDPAVAYVALSGYKAGSDLAHIYRTTDYGANWGDIQGDLPDAPINDVLVDPHDASFLYIGTDYGVYRSTNLGANWEWISDGMPIAVISDMEFHKPTRTLVAGTYGRSMFKASIPCPDPDPTDADGDGVADACDDCTDSDADGYGDPGYAQNVCPDDNCPDDYNPGQEDHDGDGIGDVCSYQIFAYDTLETPCHRLLVSNYGNAGYLSNAIGGTPGQGHVNMDYADFGDCDPEAIIYLNTASPIITRVVDADTIGFHSALWDVQSTLYNVDDGNPTIPVIETEAYQMYGSGTFVTSDFEIGMERFWLAPQQADSCDFILQCLKLYSYDGLQHSGLAIGEIVDWNVHTDNPPFNEPYTDESYKLAFVQGLEGYPEPGDCQRNDARFAGLAYLGSYLNDINDIDSVSHPRNAQIGDMELDTAITGDFKPGWMYYFMNLTGYIVWNTVDAYVLMTYFHDYTISPGDTLFVWTILATVQNGTAQDLRDEIDAAKTWFVNHLITDFVPGDADGNDLVNVSDAVYLITYIFGEGTPPDPLLAGDANCDGLVNISDVVYLIAYIFGGGPAPCEE